MYERTQRPGSGCINIGATFLKTPTGLTRSMRISIGHSRTCFNTTRSRVLQKATKQTKVELELNTRPVRLLLVEAISYLINSLIRSFTGRWRPGSIDMQQQRTLEAACPQDVFQTLRILRDDLRHRPIGFQLSTDSLQTLSQCFNFVLLVGEFKLKVLL